jgi:glycosyltransferase involved in cell wall biosynthesis
MITVVIVSYKYGHLVSHAIESVLCQSRKPDKVIVIDDGVGDCRHIPALYPEVEFHERSENMGTVANFDDALRRVTTDKCMFLGADNWLRADALEILDEEEADIVTYDIVVTGDGKDEITKRHPSEVERYQGDWYWDRSGGHHGSMLYNTKLAQEVGYRASGGSRTEEDMVLYHGMLKKGATRVHVPEGLLYYRRHRENFNQ